jgi:ribosomal protein S14
MENIENTKTVQNCFELFGVECGKGWHGLIQPIFDYVKEYNRDKDVGERIVIRQIKEKYGSLRIYTNFVTDELDEIIEKAEAESTRVCELCGTREHVGTKHDGWIMTLCRNCVQEMADKDKHAHIWCENGDDRSYVIEPKAVN